MAARKSKKAADENELTTRAVAIEETIRLRVEEIIQAVEQQVTNQDELGVCEVVYPMDTKVADNMLPREYQAAVVVWAKVLQYFEEKQMFRIRVFTNEHGENLHLLWQQAIAPEIVHASEQIINRFRVKPWS